MVDENRVRLRASCNSCNESKVRCSQQKPTCARCEHNKIQCVYGLSRRTHKDAPPIATSSSQRGRGTSSRSGGPLRLSSSDSQSNASSSSSNSTSKTARSNSALPEDVTKANNPHGSLVDEFMFAATGESDIGRLEFSDMMSDSRGSMLMVPGYMSTTGAEYAHLSTPWHGESLFGANHHGDTVGMGRYQALDAEERCTCHRGATELLALMRGDGGGGGGGGGSGSDDQRPAMSLDAQLAKLTQSIMACEASMGCTHGREDTEPMHIMTIAMLIGHVIDGFKKLASDSSSAAAAAAATGSMATLGNGDQESRPGLATPGSINMSLGGLIGGLMEPRLSWGVLELEDDDERDLRQRLYLLSFRKLERVLSRLTLHIRDLHIALAGTPDPSRALAFVIACDYTRLWLEKKVGDVKRLFGVRDEMIDPALP